MQPTSNNPRYGVHRWEDPNYLTYSVVELFEYVRTFGEIASADEFGFCDSVNWLDGEENDWKICYTLIRTPHICLTITPERRGCEADKCLHF